MPGLYDLPDEVILLTLNSGVFRLADFAAVARSCKRFKDVAEEALYAQNRDRDGSSAVDWAAEHGNMATLYKALKHRLSIEATDEKDSASESKFNPFQTAVEHGQDSAVTWFLDHGADITRRVRPRCRCRINETCILHPALCSRHASTALLLISRGAPHEYLSSGRGFYGDNDVTSLLEASLFGLDTVVETLVKHYGMNLQMGRDPRAQNALAWAAMDDGNLSTIGTLVGLGADVNWSQTEWNLSPLHCALVDGNFAIAHTLLDFGAKIHSYGYDVDNEDEEHEEQMELEMLEIVVSPLHDTVASTTYGFTQTRQIYDYSLTPRDSVENWDSERARFMKRLIELGVDVNLKAFGHWHGELQYSSPLDLAISNEDTQDVSTLLAAGAKANSKMLKAAWETYLYDDDRGECMTMMRLLLRHGARLDEPTQDGMSMLQVIARDAKTGSEMSRLHEILLLSSPKSLSREHLSEALANSLADLDWHTSTVLIRHGARVSGVDELFSIASTITDELKCGSRTYYEDPEIASLYFEPELHGCIGFLLDMGLSSEDQCLIFYDILHKEQIALAHLFLDRGLASKPEATQYLPAFLMLAASWGNVSVIKRLWQHAHEALDPALRLLIVYTAIIRDRREAVSFFMDHGTTTFEFLLPAQISEEIRLSKDTTAASQAKLEAIKRLGPDVDIEGSPAALFASREFRRTLLRLARHGSITKNPSPLLFYMLPLQLAVQYGHMDIISDLLQRIPQNADATMICRNMHIPCVLQKANEIKEMIEKAADLACWSSQLRIN